jgi:hypothetical protein
MNATTTTNATAAAVTIQAQLPTHEGETVEARESDNRVGNLGWITNHSPDFRYLSWRFLCLCQENSAVGLAFRRTTK